MDTPILLTMKQARACLSSRVEANYQRAGLLLEPLATADRSSDPPDPWLYFTVSLWRRKLAPNFAWFHGARPEQKSVHVLVFDRTRRRVLLWRRGLYKRLFPDKHTLSVTAHTDALGSGEIRVLAAAALKHDLGLTLDPRRFQSIGEEREHPHYLRGFDFTALSAAEEKALKDAYRMLKQSGGCVLDAVLSDFSAAKRTLAVFTLVPERAAAVEDLARRIERRTGIPSINSCHDRGRASLYACGLSAGEADALAPLLAQSRAIRAAKRDPTSRKNMALLDADEAVWWEWAALRDHFSRVPSRFALDVLAPYLLKPDVVAELEKQMGLAPALDREVNDGLGTAC